MEGISAYADAVRMRNVNDRYLKKPLIATLAIDLLEGIEAEYSPNTSHHDLYGDRTVMRSACIRIEDA
jgi:hypothetical protein